MPWVAEWEVALQRCFFLTDAQQNRLVQVLACAAQQQAGRRVIQESVVGFQPPLAFARLAFFGVIERFNQPLQLLVQEKPP